LLESEEALKQFAYGFESSVAPPSDMELQTIRVLSAYSSRKVWEGGYDRNHGNELKGFSRFIVDLPDWYTDIYPLWRLKDREWNTWSDISTLNISEEIFVEFWRLHNFRSVNKWLCSLPLRRNELVYISRNPELTLILQWGMLVEHWDAFCPTGWILNVVDDNPNWHLFFQHQDVIIFGCASNYAIAKHLPITFFESSIKNIKQELGFTAGWQRTNKWMQASSIYRSAVLGES
jgi:hypothetical protein